MPFGTGGNLAFEVAMNELLPRKKIRTNGVQKMRINNVYIL